MPTLGPPQELLPEKRMLFLPNLAKAAGSSCLLPRIQQVGSCAHIFGHTHFAWDACLDGVRYVQWPLGYPRERRCRLALRKLHWMLAAQGSLGSAPQLGWPRLCHLRPAARYNTAHVACCAGRIGAWLVRGWLQSCWAVNNTP